MGYGSSPSKDEADWEPNHSDILKVYDRPLTIQLYHAVLLLNYSKQFVLFLEQGVIHTL